jgi:hypothetical protein
VSCVSSTTESMVSCWVLLGGETIHPDMLSCVYCPPGGGGGGGGGMSQIPGKYIPVTKSTEYVEGYCLLLCSCCAVTYLCILTSYGVYVFY